MAKHRARFTLKEIQTLIRVAQEEQARLIFELEPDGRFRIIVNEVSFSAKPSHRDYVL